MKPSFQKYIPFKQIDIPDRTWPNNVIDRAPVWCSVDLRDGNQALVDPMTLKEKLEFFHALVDMGFKEIEIGFPSASETEYEICRELIENNHIPDDVTIQVLVQAREHLIRKTFEAIKGAKNVIVHFYNSTSTLQRKVVFKTDMQGVIDIAVEGAKLIKKLTDEYTGDTNIRFEYSPESFSGTEPDNAVAICDRVMEELGSTKENPVILNLPNTVEMCTPNTYDRILYPPPQEQRGGYHQRSPPQRQRLRRRGRRACSFGRRRARRGYALRQRRENRQHGHRYHGSEYVHSGR